MIDIKDIEKAAALGETDCAPSYEGQSDPVAYGWRSLSDGSYGDMIVPVKCVMFDKLMEKLRNDPWVKNGVAEIVPLYAAPTGHLRTAR